MMKTVTLLVLSTLALAACNDKPAASAKAPDAAPADRSSVFDPLTDSLDRARGVEDTLRENAEAQKRAVEEAEGR